MVAARLPGMGWFNTGRWAWLELRRDATATVLMLAVVAAPAWQLLLLGSLACWVYSIDEAAAKASPLNRMVVMVPEASRTELRFDKENLERIRRIKRVVRAGVASELGVRARAGGEAVDSVAEGIAPNDPASAPALMAWGGGVASDEAHDVVLSRGALEKLGGRLTGKGPDPAALSIEVERSVGGVKERQAVELRIAGVLARGAQERLLVPQATLDRIQLWLLNGVRQLNGTDTGAAVEILYDFCLATGPEEHFGRIKEEAEDLGVKVEVAETFEAPEDRRPIWAAGDFPGRAAAHEVKVWQVRTAVLGGVHFTALSSVDPRWQLCPSRQEPPLGTALALRLGVRFDGLKVEPAPAGFPVGGDLVCSEETLSRAILDPAGASVFFRLARSAERGKTGGGRKILSFAIAVREGGTGRFSGMRCTVRDSRKSVVVVRGRESAAFLRDELEPPSGEIWVAPGAALPASVVLQRGTWSSAPLAVKTRAGIPPGFAVVNPQDIHPQGEPVIHLCFPAGPSFREFSRAAGPALRRLSPGRRFNVYRITDARKPGGGADLALVASVASRRPVFSGAQAFLEVPAGRAGSDASMNVLGSSALDPRQEMFAAIEGTWLRGELGSVQIVLPASARAAVGSDVALRFERERAGRKEEILIPFRVAGVIAAETAFVPLALLNGIEAWRRGLVSFDAERGVFESPAAARLRNGHLRAIVYAEDIERVPEIARALQAMGWQTLDRSGDVAELRHLGKVLAGLVGALIAGSLLIGLFAPLLTTTIRMRAKIREIGIIRASGAGTADVLRIFGIQGFVLGVAAFVLAAGGAAALEGPARGAFARVFAIEAGTDVAKSVFLNVESAWLPALAFVLCVVCPLLGMLLPAAWECRKRPVEELRHRG